MDFSQLPKMSSTPQTPTAADPTPQPADVTARPTDLPPRQVVDYGFAPEMSFLGMWISLISGVILLALGANFARWAIATLGGKEFATNVNWTAGEKAGQPVTYFELQGGTAWMETALFLMGLALLIDAVLLALIVMKRRPMRIATAGLVGLTSVAMLLNVIVAGYLFSIGILPMMTLIALLVGGFVLFDHVAMMKRTQ